MARVLLIIALAAITVYAIADWMARSGKWTPGKLNRWVWLAVIIFLPVVGPLAWIITGLVTRAEEAQRQREAPEQPPVWLAPDDDPSAVADVADRIARRQKRSRPHFPNKPGSKGHTGSDHGDTNGRDADGRGTGGRDANRPGSDQTGEEGLGFNKSGPETPGSHGSSSDSADDDGPLGRDPRDDTNGGANGDGPSEPGTPRN